MADQFNLNLTPEHFARWHDAGQRLPPCRLALLTGFPRSGTTLLEQVLDSHPGLVSSEEKDVLSREVFPALIHDRPHDHPIRVWVSGCATGEEAYSLAITLVEFLQKHQSDIRVQIFATDVSETAVEHARAGLYPPSIESDVTPDRLRRFFTKHDGGYRVSKAIRRSIIVSVDFRWRHSRWFSIAALRVGRHALMSSRVASGEKSILSLGYFC